MKKIKFLSFLVLAITLTTGCAAKPAPTNFGDNVLTDEMLSNNIADLSELENETGVTSFVGQKLFENDVIYQTYPSAGIIVVKNSRDNIGFYSTLSQKYIIAPKYYLPWIRTMSVSANAYTGSIIKILYDNSYLIFDGIGNVIYQGEYDYDVSLSLINDSVYLELNSFYRDSVYFKYNNEMNLLYSVPSLPDPTLPADEETSFSFGDNYLDERLLDLTDFDHAGYHLAFSNRSFVTFNTDNEQVASFSVPLDTSAIGLVGNYVVYQTVYGLTEDAQDYSFSRDGKKYGLESYRVEYLTGKKEELKLGYVFEGIILPFYDAQKVYKYGAASLNVINQFRTLTAKETYLVSEDGVLHDNISARPISGYIRLSETRYFNTATKFIYDASFKEISYLGSIENLQIMAKDGLIKGTIDGMHGAVDFNGIVKIPFNFSQILSGVVNSSILVMKDYMDVYRFSISAGTSTYLGMYQQQLDAHLFVVKNQDTILFVSENTNYESVNVGNYYSYSFSYYSHDFIDSGYGYITIRLSYSTIASTAYTKYYTFAKKAFTQKVISSVENTSLKMDGSTSDKAVQVEIGSATRLHRSYTNTSLWITFTTLYEGYYHFDFGDTNSYIYSMFTSQNGLLNSYYSGSNTTSATHLLVKGTYYFRLSLGSNANDFDFEISSEDGRTQSYPLIYGSDINNGLNINVQYNTSKYYIRFIASQTARYNLSISSDKYGLYTESTNTLVTSPINLIKNTTYSYYLAYKSSSTFTPETVKVTLNYNLDDITVGSADVKPFILSESQDAVSYGYIANNSGQSEMYATFTNTSNDVKTFKFVLTSNYSGASTSLRGGNFTGTLLTPDSSGSTLVYNITMASKDTVYLYSYINSTNPYTLSVKIFDTYNLPNFTVSNVDPAFPFKPYSTSDVSFTTFGSSSSGSYILEITPKATGTISFSYVLYNSSYDYIYVIHNNTQKLYQSGSISTRTASFSVQADDTLLILFQKNSNVSSNYLRITNLSFI